MSKTPSETDSGRLRPRRWVIVTLSLVALLVFLVARIPARWALAQVAPGLGLHAATVSGTLWNGSAEQLQIGGFTIQRASWDIAAWRLLTGKLAGHIDARLEDGFVRGDAAIGLGNAIELNQVKAAIPAARVTDRIPAANGLVAAGQVSIQLDHLVMNADGIQAAAGTATLSDLKAAYGYDGTLGTYTGEIKTDPDGKITGAAHDVSGPVMLQATLTLEQGSTYHVRGSLAAHDDKSQIAQALNMLGRADSRGAHPFQYSGRLPLPRP